MPPSFFSMSKRLLGQERVGSRVDRDWLHTGQDGRTQITVETTEDVEPAIRRAAQLKDMPDTEMGRRRAVIPTSILLAEVKAASDRWGCDVHSAYREIMLGTTKRAQSVIRNLMYGREYRKFQR